MPDEQDENLVPPPKVMRKRLNGVYRADSGFSGPTRRYVLIVALLVGLASIPTLAAITAGSNELSNGSTHTMDVPFLPPASPGPIRTRRPGVVPGSGSMGPSPTAAVPRSAEPPPLAAGPPPGAKATIRPGRIAGQAGRRKARPEPTAPQRGEHTAGARPSSDSQSRRASDSQGRRTNDSQGRRTNDSYSRRSSVSHSRRTSVSHSRPAKSSHHGVTHSGSKHPTGSGSGPAPSGTPGDADRPSVTGDDDSGPDNSEPDDDQPVDSDESPAWSDQADFGRRRECDRPRWSHHRTIHIDRSDDWSEDRRRSAVTERPPNVGPTRAFDRDNNRRPAPDDNQIVNRAYRGNHRLAGQHHADRPTPAEQRDSRMGRHHADQPDSNLNW